MNSISWNELAMDHVLKFVGHDRETLLALSYTSK